MIMADGEPVTVVLRLISMKMSQLSFPLGSGFSPFSGPLRTPSDWKMKETDDERGKCVSQGLCLDGTRYFDSAKWCTLESKVNFKSTFEITAP